MLSVLWARETGNDGGGGGRGKREARDKSNRVKSSLRFPLLLSFQDLPVSPPVVVLGKTVGHRDGTKFGKPS